MAALPRGLRCERIPGDRLRIARRARQAELQLAGLAAGEEDTADLFQINWQALQASPRPEYLDLALLALMHGAVLGMVPADIAWTVNTFLVRFGLPEYFREVMGMWPNNYEDEKERQHLLSRPDGLAILTQYQDLWHRTKAARAQLFTDLVNQDASFAKQLTQAQLRVIASSAGLNAEQAQRMLDLGKASPALHTVEIDDPAKKGGGGLGLAVLVALILLFFVVRR